jgi:hypothetical protein
MHSDQIFTLLMLIVAVLATALVVGSVLSYWHKLRAGPRLCPTTHRSRRALMSS